MASEVRTGRVAWVISIALLAACFVPWPRTPESAASDAPAASFSSQRALAELRSLLGDGAPHPGGTPAHAAVRERLLARLRELGCETEVQETLARGPGGRIALVRNVVARRSGQHSGKCVLLAAHYDSVGAGPGASDDGSGVATLVEVARALGSGAPLPRPVVFLFSDAEEAGLIGASAFASEHRWNAEVGVVLNVEARGTGGPSLMFETSGPSAALIPHLDRAAVRPFASSLSDLIYKYMPNDTDLSVFRARGVPGFNFAYIGGLERYHTPLDDLAHLDPRSLQHHGDQVLALTRELAGADLEHLAGGDAIYFDVLGLRVVSWSRSAGLVASMVVLAFALMRARRAVIAQLVRPSRLALALLAPATCLAAALAGSYALTAFLAKCRGVPDAGVEHPELLRAAMAALVLAIFAAIAGFRFARVRFAEAWIAGLGVAAAGAAISTLCLARASHLALAPALAWSAAELALDPTRRGRAWAALLLPAAMQAVLWIPITYATELGFGFRLGPMVACPMAFLLASLWPGWIELEARLRTWTACGALLVALILCAVSAALPASSPEHPTWLDLRYILDADAGKARWEASTFGARLPAALREIAPFERATTPPFPWLSLDPSMYVAPAPTWKAALPELEVLQSSNAPGVRLVRARIRSPRGAPRLHLHLPPEVSVTAVRWREHELSQDLETARTQIFFAVPPEGFEIDLRVRSDGPVRVWLLDQDWSLPDEMRPLLRARPAACVPRSDGDVSVLGHSIEL